MSSDTSESRHLSFGRPQQVFWRSILRRLARALLGIGVVLGTLTVLIYAVGDWPKLLDVAFQLNPRFVVLAFGAYLLATLLRAERFRRLSRLGASYGGFLRIAILQQSLRAILPAQLGEFAYPPLLRQLTGAHLTDGLGDLLIARLYDLLFVCVALLAGGFGLGIPDDSKRVFLVSSILMLGIALLLLAGLHRVLQPLRRWLLYLRRRSRSAFFSGAFRRTTQLQQALARHDPLSSLAILGSSALIAIFALVRVYSLIAAFGILLDVSDALFLFGAIHLLATLPIRAFGGVGIKEAGLVALLMLMNYDVEQAAAITVLFTATALVFPFILVAFVFAKWQRYNPDGAV